MDFYTWRVCYTFSCDFGYKLVRKSKLVTVPLKLLVAKWSLLKQMHVLIFSLSTLHLFLSWSSELLKTKIERYDWTIILPFFVMCYVFILRLHRMDSLELIYKLAKSGAQSLYLVWLCVCVQPAKGKLITWTPTYWQGFFFIELPWKNSYIFIRNTWFKLLLWYM